MRWFFLIFGVATLLVLSIAGFRGGTSEHPPIEVFPDMDRQLKYRAQAPSAFFADGRADRMPVEGTIPFNVPVQNSYFLSGKMGANYGDGIPREVKVSMDTLQRGQQRYEINCAICHGSAGDGRGIVSEYGFGGIASFHTPRLREMPDGQIFDVIANGKGLMNAYPHISLEDRWAIISYIRALQLSQNAKLEDIPEDQRENLSTSYE